MRRAGLWTCSPARRALRASSQTMHRMDVKRAQLACTAVMVRRAAHAMLGTSRLLIRACARDVPLGRRGRMVPAVHAVQAPHTTKPGQAACHARLAGTELMALAQRVQLELSRILIGWHANRVRLGLLVRTAPARSIVQQAHSRTWQGLHVRRALRDNLAQTETHA